MIIHLIKISKFRAWCTIIIIIIIINIIITIM